MAALVLGVASLVTALSFVFFPLGFLGGIIAIVLGIIAITRGRTKGATNPGQAGAGIACGVLAVITAVIFGVRVGTLVARNTSVLVPPAAGFVAAQGHDADGTGPGGIPHNFSRWPAITALQPASTGQSRRACRARDYLA